MSTNKIRSSQAINSFGPGAMLDLPESSVIVGGLDGWKYEADQEIPLINEPRLVDKLRGILDIQSLTLRKPPAASQRTRFWISTKCEVLPFPLNGSSSKGPKQPKRAIGSAGLSIFRRSNACVSLTTTARKRMLSQCALSGVVQKDTWTTSTG